MLQILNICKNVKGLFLSFKPMNLDYRLGTKELGTENRRQTSTLNGNVSSGQPNSKQSRYA
jgi:hypothetical protein